MIILSVMMGVSGNIMLSTEKESVIMWLEVDCILLPMVSVHNIKLGNYSKSTYKVSI